VEAKECASGVPKSGVDHRVATTQIDVHVVDDGVHLRDGVALRLELLPIHLERNLARRIEFARNQLQLDEESTGSGYVVMARLTWPWPHDARHEEPDLGRREELAGALTRTFRKLSK